MLSYTDACLGFTELNASLVADPPCSAIRLPNSPSKENVGIGQHEGGVDEAEGGADQGQG